MLKEMRKKDSVKKACINFSLSHIYTKTVIYHARCARNFLTGGKRVLFTQLYGDKGRFNSLNANRNEVQYEINKMEAFLFLQSKEHNFLNSLFLIDNSARYKKNSTASMPSYILLNVKAILENMWK